MEGKYTHAGNFNQAYGEPLYDGTQGSWIKEEISLEPFLGEQIKVRFVLISDGNVVGDGFYWDDMTVTVIDLETGIEAQNITLPQGINISVHPNPASGIIIMNYTIDRFYPGLYTFKVYDIAGHKVYESSLAPDADMNRWDVSSWSSGMYFYNVSFDQTVIASGKLIVK
jgi:hypothetical protein